MDNSNIVSPAISYIKTRMKRGKYWRISSMYLKPVLNLLSQALMNSGVFQVNPIVIGV